MAELDELFDGGLDEKMDFLNETQRTNNDGIYRVDLTKVKDKSRGYRSKIRFLPNITQDGKLGEMAIQKISHYVNIPNAKEIGGWFDSPKNFDKECPLTKLYYNMKNSKNAILAEKADVLNYSKKYYSYILVLEDEQQPELVGKIMILQYGTQIKDKIQAERNGDISGEPCNVFSLERGKDLVLIVKEIQTGDRTYPDYKSSMFKPEKTPIPLYNDEKGEFKRVPLNDEGKVESKYKSAIQKFLLDRDYELEDFAPQPLSEEQEAKITEISNFLLGKSSNSYENAKPKQEEASSDDFLEDANVSSGNLDNSKTEEVDDDDFFNDI